MQLPNTTPTFDVYALKTSRDSAERKRVYLQTTDTRAIALERPLTPDAWYALPRNETRRVYIPVETVLPVGQHPLIPDVQAALDAFLANAKKCTCGKYKAWNHCALCSVCVTADIDKRYGHRMGGNVFAPKTYRSSDHRENIRETKGLT